MKGRNSRSTKTKSTGTKSSRSKDPLKVVYISNPMKVRTSASNFRSLVQQLTGKHSDISQYFDSLPSDFVDFESDDSPYNSDCRQVSSSEISREDSSPSSTTMDSLFPPIEEAFLPEIMEGFASSDNQFLLPDFSDFFSSEFHSLPSYNELI